SPSSLMRAIFVAVAPASIPTAKATSLTFLPGLYDHCSTSFFMAPIKLFYSLSPAHKKHKKRAACPLLVLEQRIHQFSDSFPPPLGFLLILPGFQNHHVSLPGSFGHEGFRKMVHFPF